MAKPGSLVLCLRQVSPGAMVTPTSVPDRVISKDANDIDGPVKIQVIARGPLNNPDSANTLTATQWVIPGRHITGGDAWLLEMPNFSVSATAEATFGTST